MNRMWVVMVRVREQSNWFAHGPFRSFSDARNYDRGLAGIGWNRQIVQLVEPWKAKGIPQEPPK